MTTSAQKPPRPSQAATGGRLLDNPTIFEAGLRLVDHQGLEGLSIRKLADSLGVGAMTLYRYVSTKDEIIQGIADIAFHKFATSMSWEGHWSDQLQSAARQFRELLQQHPGVLHLFLAQPISGPRIEDWSIHMFQALEQGGLEGETAVYAFTAVHSFVLGFALLERSRGAAPGKSATLPGSEFKIPPAAARALNRRTSDEAFEYGLARIISSLH